MEQNGTTICTKPLVIGFSGKIGCGKTTICSILERLLKEKMKLSVETLSFGTVLKKKAAEVFRFPLDSPTAAEFADIDSKNGTTIAQLVAQMVLTPSQGAAILSQSKDSMFYGHIEQQDSELDNDAENLLDDLMGGEMK